MVNNGAVNVVSTIIFDVMPLAAKSELVALYLNAKYGVVIQNKLI